MRLLFAGEAGMAAGGWAATTSLLCRVAAIVAPWIGDAAAKSASDRRAGLETALDGDKLLKIGPLNFESLLNPRPKGAHFISGFAVRCVFGDPEPGA
jgi:hypothetical protein